MNYKTLAALGISIIVIILVFPAANIIYPHNVSQKPIDLHQKNLDEKLFKNQSEEKFNYSKTYFNPTGNKTTTIEGYVISSSNNTAISNKSLYAIMGNYYTIADTNSTGFYKIEALLLGNGTIYLKVPDYNGIYKKISLNGNNICYNLSLNPEKKYKFSGYTLLNGNRSPGINLIFSGIFNNANATSNSNGYFSIGLYNQTYNISADNYNLNHNTEPVAITINGKDLNQNITVYRSMKPVYKISGYVYNNNGSPLKNAIVSNIYGTVHTNNSGYYSINASYGGNTIYFYKTGYNGIAKTVNIINNITLNVTLPNATPFAGSNKGYGGAGSGYGNGTSQKHINSSDVNYSNKTSLIITGNINTTNNTSVSYQYIYFIINVNNTYFYDNTTTNYSGAYTISLNYNGDYHIAVYSLFYHIKLINVSAFNKINYKNITLIPKHTYNVNGTVKNGYNRLGINGTVIIENSKPVILIKYNYNSIYNISLPEGYYRIIYKSPGFNNLTYNMNLTNNITINENLIPVNSIGKNINIYSNKDNISTANITKDIPYINSTNINNNLTFNMLNGTKNISITLDFGKNVLDQKFMLLIKENGVIYNYTGITNNSGYSKIDLYYTGIYSISGYFLNYTVVQKNYLLNNSMSISTTLDKNIEHNYNITIRSDYPVSGSYSVPYKNIKGYGGIFSVYYNSVTSNNYGTYFNYLLPGGVYNISYNNIHYVNSSFNIKVSGNNNKYTDNVYAYIIKIGVTTNTSYKYILTYNDGNYTDTTNNTYLTSYGINNLKIYKNGNELYDYNITLTKTYPAYYINVTLNNNLNNTVYNVSHIHNSNYNYTYSLNINNTVHIYSIKIPYNVAHYLQSYNFTIYDNGKAVYNGINSGQYINLTNYITVKGNITVNIYGHLAGIINDSSGYSVIYNYNVNVKDSVLKER